MVNVTLDALAASDESLFSPVLALCFIWVGGIKTSAVRGGTGSLGKHFLPQYFSRLYFFALRQPSPGGGWSHFWEKSRPRTGPTVTQGFFSHMRRFLVPSALAINGLGAISLSRTLPDNRTTTNSVWCGYSVGSASSLLSRSLRCG